MGSKVQGSSPPWPPARRAYASESATGCVSEIAFTLYGIGFPPPHLGLPSLGQGFHSRPWTAFGMRIYDKRVSFVSLNPKFGAKLAIIWGNEHFYEDVGSLMPSLSLFLNVGILYETFIYLDRIYRIFAPQSGYILYIQLILSEK